MGSSPATTMASVALANLTTLASQIVQANLTNLTTPTIQNETKASIPDAILPKKGSAEEEHSFSMAIFFVLSVIGNVSELIRIDSMKNDLSRRQICQYSNMLTDPCLIHSRLHHRDPPDSST